MELINKRFGNLVVCLKTTQRKWGQIIWLCQCDCGKTRKVLTSRLLRGLTKSCGCLRASKVNKTRKDRQLALWKYLFSRSIVNRAKIKKLNLSIQLEDFINLSSKPCYYCGRPFSLILCDKARNEDRLISDTQIKYNGLDQIKASQGYTKDNVVSCCIDCNRAKGRMAVEEFKNFITRVYTHLISISV